MALPDLTISKPVALTVLAMPLVADDPNEKITVMELGAAKTKMKSQLLVVAP